MPIPGRRQVAWWSPDPRGILPVDALVVSRSLRRSRSRYSIRIDTAFADVVRGCSDPRRDGGWITSEIEAAYTQPARARLGPLGRGMGRQREAGGRALRGEGRRPLRRRIDVPPRARRVEGRAGRTGRAAERASGRPFSTSSGSPPTWPRSARSRSAAPSTWRGCRRHYRCLPADFDTRGRLRPLVVTWRRSVNDDCGMDAPPSPTTHERDRPWMMRTYSGHSTARASNELYRTNLAKGQTGLSIAFDLPTQTGLRRRRSACSRRGGQGRGAGLPHRAHAPAPRRDPRRGDEHLDDHQRSRRLAARPLRRPMPRSNPFRPRPCAAPPRTTS